MRLPAQFLPHRVIVTPLEGAGGMGKTYGDPCEIPALVEDGNRMVRNADGEEVVSTAQVHCDFAWHVPVGSIVTIWPDTARERDAEVISVGGSIHPSVPGHQTLALT